jgi:hypothetical protein
MAKTTVAARDERWTKLAHVSRDNPDLPVAIGNGIRYLDAAEYAPPQMRERLVSVVDADLAIRIAGTNTLEKNLNILARSIPLRVEALAPFLAATHRFILQSGGWLTPYLLDNKCQLILLSQGGAAPIFMVERRRQKECPQFRSVHHLWACQSLTSGAILPYTEPWRMCKLSRTRAPRRTA